jgi:hypothetical protein
MTTPSDVALGISGKHAKRIERRRHRREVIQNRSYAVDDHVIWLGRFTQSTRRCWFIDHAAGGVAVDVKRFVAQSRVPKGCQALWRSTCGHNRCIAPEHIELVKLVPLIESSEEA